MIGRAAVLIRPGVIELHDVVVPQPSAGEILVKVKVALTCGTDFKAFTRGHALIPMPGGFGHEFSGIVAGVGKGVKRYREGDEIMAVHSAPCLSCGYCKVKHYNFCENIMKTKILGAYADYILLPRHIVKQNAYHKPHNLSFEEAALLEPFSCVIHGIEQLRIIGNDCALIIGAGPIGLIHLILLKQKGLHVTVTDLHQDKLTIAKKLGADRAETFAVMEPQSDFMGFDYVFECTGSREVWEKSVRYVRRGGTIILFGGCASGTRVCYDAGKLHYDGITLKGVFHYAPSDVKKAYKRLAGRTMKVSALISGFFPLEQVQTAFQALSEGKGIKYAIIPEHRNTH